MQAGFAAEGFVRGSQVVLRNDGPFVGWSKRAIANTVCITVSASDRASISVGMVSTLFDHGE